MEKYIKAALDRDQQTLLRQTLEESIPKDHPVRSVDFIVELFDFREWESEYPGGGRPSYAPQDMCKLLIYGGMVGIKSSRKLEYACLNNRDFIWLMRGLAPDHDTIAEFRQRNKPRFREIFKESVRVGIEAGIISMRRVAIDGTRVLSNSSRWGTGNQEEIEKMLLEVDTKIEKMLGEAEIEDREEDDLFGKGESPNRLSGDLADLKKREEILRKAHDRVVKKVEKARKEGRSDENKRVPVTDPDSDVMKCKGGGYAPNYNAHIAVDCGSGMIVANGVDDEHRDTEHLEKMCAESIETTGMQIEQVLADSGYSTTENLEYLEEKSIDAYIPPVNTSEKKKKKKKKPWPDDIPKVGISADGSPVDGSGIPLNKDGYFDKSAFRYDHEKDCYICPMGHEMPRCSGSRRRRKKTKVTQFRYRCFKCRNCQFKPVCTSSRHNRSISRNSDARIHEIQRIKMGDPAGKEVYKFRRQTVEPVFGVIKEIQGLRQFLMRGLESVRTEWDIASTTINVRRLIKHFDRVLAYADAK